MAQLRVATLNLRNLHVAGGQRYSTDVPYTAEEYKRKRDWTAEAIRRANPDIIGLQELWSREAIDSVFSQADLDGQYSIAGPSLGDPNKIWNAIAVRKPHELVSSGYKEDLPESLKLKKGNEPGPSGDSLHISVNTKKFSRGVLRAKIRLAHSGSGPPLPDVVVFVAHLKSKRPMRLDAGNNPQPSKNKEAVGAALSTIKRTAEAAGLRFLISSAQSESGTGGIGGRPVIVLGDLNDPQLSNTLNILTFQAPYRLREASGIGSASKWGLYSVSTLQELRSLRDVYYTYIYEGFRESLDHILVSQHFYDHSSHRVWSFNHTRIFNDHLEEADEGNDNEMPESDHALVEAIFDLNRA